MPPPARERPHPPKRSAGVLACGFWRRPAARVRAPSGGTPDELAGVDGRTTFAAKKERCAVSEVIACSLLFEHNLPHRWPVEGGGHVRIARLVGGDGHHAILDLINGVGRFAHVLRIRALGDDDDHLLWIRVIPQRVRPLVPFLWIRSVELQVCAVITREEEAVALGSCPFQVPCTTFASGLGVFEHPVVPASAAARTKHKLNIFDVVFILSFRRIV